jgi:hypothetical protein
VAVGENELLIVLTSKRPQQRSALKAEQIREWVLIDHRRTLCRARLDIGAGLSERRLQSDRLPVAFRLGWDGSERFPRVLPSLRSSSISRPAGTTRAKALLVDTAVRMTITKGE